MCSFESEKATLQNTVHCPKLVLCFLTHLCCTVMNFSLYKKYMYEKNAIFVKEGNFIRFLYQRNLHRYTVYVTS